MNASSAANKKWFPPSSLAEFLLLCILVGLLLAIWLQAKRDLSGPREPVLLTMHPTTSRAAIYSENGLRVVDCITGKTLLRTLPFANYRPNPTSEESPWHVWPGSGADFAWTRKFNPGRVLTPTGGVAGFQANIEVEPEEERTWDAYGGKTVNGMTSSVPGEISSLDSTTVRGPLHFTFSEKGNALIVRAKTSAKKLEYIVIDLHSGKKTVYANSDDPTGFAARMESVGDLIVFGKPNGQIDKLIDPGLGFVDPIAFPQASSALERSEFDEPRLPLYAMDEQGRSLRLRLVQGDGVTLVAEPEEESESSADQLTSKTLKSWSEDLSRRWQSKDRLVLWRPKGFLPGEETIVWLVTSQVPYLRPAAWPFSSKEDITQLSMEVDARGITARRFRPNGRTGESKPESIYWDFENVRVATIPDDTQKTRRYGDYIVAQTNKFLQTIDLNSGKVVQTISLRQNTSPPLTLAWIIWLGVWCFVKRKADTRDLTRAVGAVSAISFALLIALSYYYHSPQLGWLLNLLLVASLLISLVVIAATRRASIISLAICSLLTLGLLFSDLQHGFAIQNMFLFGNPPISNAGRLAEALNQTDQSDLKKTIKDLKTPWLTPQKTPLPAPQVTIDSN